MKDSLCAIWRWVRWPLYIVVGAYVALVIYRVPILMDKQKTAEDVAAIHAQHITLADVTGDTMIKTGVDQAAYDATVAGIDSNNNGIRDDVEIAIWKKYPNSAKVRAAELQYAMTEQMYLTRVYNTETWKAVAEEDGRASACISLSITENSPSKSFQIFRARSKEVEAWVFNTQIRKDARDRAYNFTTSGGSAPGNSCDIDLTKLPN